MAERPRTHELIHKHLDQVATQDELADLDRALGADGEAVDDFVEAARIDAFLAEHFGQRHRALEVASLLDARQAEPAPATRSALRWAAVAAVALLAVGIGLLGWLAYRAHRQTASASGRHEVVSGHVLIDGEKTRVVRVGVRVVVPSTAPAVLRLADGSYAELEPASEVILRGRSHGVRQAVELLDGKGRFRVAKGKGQFRVDTLLGAVTALGTDFSVEYRLVRPSEALPKAASVRALTVAVSEGTVEVEFCGQTCLLSAGARRVFSAGVRIDSACGPPVPPKPSRPSAAESVLPLPATPQRRTERKRPPAPPAVVVKLKSGGPADWATDTNDIRNLLLWMQTKLKIAFSYEEKALAEVGLDAERLPMLYRTGHHAFAFTPAERQRLRDYVLKGGFIYLDACCGRKEFGDSVRGELAKIFPRRPLRKLPPDHPLYHCTYDVTQVAYTPAAGIVGLAPPPFEGIDVGCRTAVVFSPCDLSCGWDMHTHATCAGVRAEHALKLGANLIAYAMATKAMGTSLAESRVYVDKEKAGADTFRIGQVVHGGQWNPDPAGLSMLLDAVSTTTSLKVSYSRPRPLRLDSKALTTHPFIYMTGHDDFALNAQEVGALRAYLKAGGFVLADACCGRRAFDAAFRREMAKVLPGVALERLMPSHRIYSIHHKIDAVRTSQAAVVRGRATSPGPPMLEGMELNGQLAVVYSPLDLGCGWELKPHPYGVGYESRDAIRLGVNIVVYAVSH